MATLEKFINALHKNARSLTAPLRAICPLSKICSRALQQARHMRAMD
jgi:hypothetical protein